MRCESCHGKIDSCPFSQMVNSLVWTEADVTTVIQVAMESPAKELCPKSKTILKKVINGKFKPSTQQPEIFLPLVPELQSEELPDSTDVDYETAIKLTDSFFVGRKVSPRESEAILAIFNERISKPSDLDDEMLTYWLEEKERLLQEYCPGWSHDRKQKVDNLAAELEARWQMVLQIQDEDLNR